VHRDIKPSNILVGDDGRPVLLDFGIARLLASDDTPAAAESTAVTALTPEYASPEQVRGESLSTATDVYSLGVLLYRLLTGCHPTGPGLTSPLDHARAIIEQEPRPASAAAPAERRRRLAGDLDVIVATALRKSPRERYASVDALAADLRRHLKHEPIAARAESATYRAGKFVRRHWTSVTAAAVVATALGGAAAALLVQGRQSARDRDFALQQLARAEATIDLNEFLLADAAPEGRPFTAGDLLVRAEALLNRLPVDPPDATTVQSLVSVGNQFQSQDEDGNARRVLARAFELAQKLPADHVVTRAIAGCAFANTLARGNLDDLQRAQTLVAESLRLIPDGRPFVLDRVRCERNAGAVARHAGDSAADVAHVSAARRLLLESGLGSPNAVVEAELAMATAYRSAGRMVEADAAFRQGLEQLRALGRERTERAGTVLNDWGLTLLSLGRPLDADRAFKEAVAISQADASGASVSPMLLLNAARPVLELGHEDQAIAMIERSIDEATRHDDQVVQLQALMLLAGAERQRGQLDRATVLFDQAEVQLRQRLPPGHVAFASLALQRANVALARGRLPEARALADEALAKAEAVAPDNELVSGALLRRAQIAIAAGQPELAVADATRAVEAETRRATAGTLSSRQGRMLLTLGECQRAAGHDADARATLELAARHLEATLGSTHADTVKAGQLLAALAR
jgi:tetratricopeptide (TPR) repeat protein